GWARRGRGGERPAGLVGRNSPGQGNGIIRARGYLRQGSWLGTRLTGRPDRLRWRWRGAARDARPLFLLRLEVRHEASPGSGRPGSGRPAGRPGEPRFGTAAVPAVSAAVAATPATADADP